MSVTHHYDSRHFIGTQLTDLSGNNRHAQLLNTVKHKDLLYVIGTSSTIELPDVFQGKDQGYSMGWRSSKGGRNNTYGRMFFTYNSATSNESSVYTSFGSDLINYYVVKDASEVSHYITGTNVVFGELTCEVITHAANGDIKKYEDDVLVTESNIHYPDAITREKTYLASGSVAYTSLTSGVNQLVESFVFCDHVCTPGEVALINRIGTPEPYYFNARVTEGGSGVSWTVRLIDPDIGYAVDETTSEAGTGLYTLYAPVLKAYDIHIIHPLGTKPNHMISKQLPDGRLTSG